jgi:EAL and modified HD-GYP domain-containing signal transduction protein
MLSTHDIPRTGCTISECCREGSRPELDLVELEKLIKAEASVCYRLLRYLNSAMFSFSREIHCVKHALSLLGKHDVRRWVRLAAAVGAGQDKRSVAVGLGAGRFGELLSPIASSMENPIYSCSVFFL